MGQDEWRRVFDVHLNGTFYVTRAAFPVMRDNAYGRIVFVSSNAGLFGNFGQANYGAAKAAVLGFCRVTAIEGEKRGVFSNVIAPIARTRMTEELLGEAAAQLAPEAVVPMVTFLASPLCDSNGFVYSAAGRRYARVFTALASGWVAPEEGASAETIAANIKAIQAEDGYIVPRSVFDELDAVKAALAAKSG